MSDDYRLPCELSRDGQFLIYSQRDAQTGYDLWMLPLFGNRQPKSVLNTEHNEWCGTLSPDNRWIAYASDESGRSEIYVRAFSQEGTAPKGNGWSPTTADTGRNGGVMAKNCCTSMPTEES
jgi:hypothetical protein